MPYHMPCFLKGKSLQAMAVHMPSCPIAQIMLVWVNMLILLAKAYSSDMIPPGAGQPSGPITFPLEGRATAGCGCMSAITAPLLRSCLFWSQRPCWSTWPSLCTIFSVPSASSASETSGKLGACSQIIKPHHRRHLLSISQSSGIFIIVVEVKDASLAECVAKVEDCSRLPILREAKILAKGRS